MIPFPIFTDANPQPRNQGVRIPQENIAHHLFRAVFILDHRGKMNLIIIMLTPKMFNHADTVDIAQDRSVLNDSGIELFLSLLRLARVVRKTV